MENKEKKTPLSELMETTMSKLHSMADSNTIVGQPIETVDGVTLIPISRVSVGFGLGGSDYGKGNDKFGGGGGAGARIDPVAFLVIRDGQTRMLPVSIPAVTTVDRVLDLAPQLFDRVEGLINKKKEKDSF